MKRVRSDVMKQVQVQRRGPRMDLPFVAPRQQNAFKNAVKAAMVAQKTKDAGFVDLAAAAYACNTTGSITLIATIAQGVTVNTRVGKKAAYKSLQVRGHVVSDVATVTAEAVWMIVYDRKPAGALPAITAILGAANSQAFLNDVNSDRFQIVARRDFGLVGNATTLATGQEFHKVDEYIKLNKRQLEFNALATGAIDDISKGALYLVTVGNVAAGTADAIAVLAFRTRFVDVEG